MSFYFNWNKVLNIPVSLNYNIRNILLIVVGFFCIQFVVQTINQILIAAHKAGAASVITFIGQLIVLASIFIVKKFIPGNLVILTVILAGIPIVIFILSSFFLFSGDLRAFAPTIANIDFHSAKSIVNLGGVFFLIQIASMVIFQTDNFVIARIIGPEAVTTFNVSYKLFSVVISVMYIIVTPLWSAFTDAYSRKDFEWIKKSVNKMRLLWIVLSIISFILFAFSKFIYKVWLNDSVTVSFSLSFTMFVYVVIYLWQTIHVYVLNGVGKIRLQLVVNICCAVVNIPLAIVLGHRFGLEGIIASNIAVLIVMGLLFSYQCRKIINGTAVNIWNK